MHPPISTFRSGRGDPHSLARSPGTDRVFHQGRNKHCRRTRRKTVLQNPQQQLGCRIQEQSRSWRVPQQPDRYGRLPLPIFRVLPYSALCCLLLRASYFALPPKTSFKHFFFNKTNSFATIKKFKINYGDPKRL